MGAIPFRLSNTMDSITEAQVKRCNKGLARNDVRMFRVYFRGVMDKRLGDEGEFIEALERFTAAAKKLPKYRPEKECKFLTKLGKMTDEDVFEYIYNFVMKHGKPKNGVYHWEYLSAELLQDGRTVRSENWVGYMWDAGRLIFTDGHREDMRYCALLIDTFL